MSLMDMADSAQSVPVNNKDVAFPQALARHRKVVQATLRETIAPNGTSIYHMIRYHLGWADVQGHPTTLDGGKALRAMLALLACEWAGGQWQDAIPAAMSLELLHNFSLIHDDIQDGDKERRHRPTVWSVWGRPKAIIAGNATHCLADLMLLSTHDRQSTPAAVTLDLSHDLAHRCLEMIQGQYLDLAFETKLDVTVAQYLDMVAQKTGALMACAMFMGALLATRDRKIAHTFGQFGRLLGLAFQIRDDLLGVWGNPSNTGKATGADIQRRKKSFPAVYALEQAHEKDGEVLRHLYAQETLTNDDVHQVLEIMDRLDTYTLGQQLAEAKGQEALSTLAGLPLSQRTHQECAEVVAFLVTRQH